MMWGNFLWIGFSRAMGLCTPSTRHGKTLFLVWWWGGIFYWLAFQGLRGYAPLLPGILKRGFYLMMWGNFLRIVFSRTKGVMHPFNPAHPFYSFSFCFSAVFVRTLRLVTLTQKVSKKVKACLKVAGPAVDSSRVFLFDGSGFFSSVISTFMIFSCSTAMAAAARQSGEFVLLGVLSF